MFFTGRTLNDCCSNPVMPAMPLVSHKRKLNSEQDSNLPTAKRICLTDVMYTENNDSMGDKQVNEFSTQCSSISHKTSLKEIQLSSLDLLKPFDLEASIRDNGGSVYGHLYDGKEVVLDEDRNNESLRNNSTGTSALDSMCLGFRSTKCREPRRMSLLMRQPSLVLVKVNKHKIPGLCNQCPHSISSEALNIIRRGFVHRMANLNAKACVAAFFQSEKKVTPNQTHYECKKTAKPILKSRSMSVIGVSSASKCLLNVEPSESRAMVVTLNAVPSTINFETRSSVDISTCTRMLHDMDGVGMDGSIVPSNKLGLLYNGDTIHPHARIFLTQSVGNPPRLPKTIVPTLVPSWSSTVRRAVRKATSTGVVHRNKKISKVIILLLCLQRVSPL